MHHNFVIIWYEQIQLVQEGNCILWNFEKDVYCKQNNKVLFTYRCDSGLVIRSFALIPLYLESDESDTLP